MYNDKEIDILIKEIDATGAFYFENRDEMCAYVSLLSHGRPFMIMKSQKYVELCDIGFELYSNGLYFKALSIFDLCLNLNPIAIRARFGKIICKIKVKKWNDAILDLKDLFPFIITREQATAYYDYFAQAEMGRKNFIGAVACMAHRGEFKIDFNWQSKVDSVVKESPVSLNIALNNLEYILRTQDIPFIDRKSLLERKRKYNYPFYLNEQNINAVIDGKTHEVITDSIRFKEYDKMNLTAYSFDTIEEALIYAANANGKNIAQANRNEYLDLFELACDYVNEEKYEKALETFCECYYINPICLDARLNASYFHTYFNRFDEAKLRLERMFKYIVNDTYAMLFYRYYGILENAKKNFRLGGACFLYALSFKDDYISNNIISVMKNEHHLNIEKISKNPQLILLNSDIPVLTKDEINRRRIYYRIDKI